MAYALADLIDVNPSMVSHYESGRHQPSLETLRRIADTLRLPLHFFQSPAPSHEDRLLFWRSQAAATKLERSRSARRFEWLLSVVNYLEQYVALPPVVFPEFNVPADPRALSDEVIESVASECREFWGLPDGPIPSLVRQLENRGAVVATHALAAKTLDAHSHWHFASQRPYFVIGSDKKSAARFTLNTGHELAHIALHRNIEARLFNDAAVHKLMEQQAMRFAGAFLLPADSFASDLYSVSLDAFVSLKEKWRVSIQAMIKRAETLDLLSSDDARNLWIRLSRRGWRHKEPLDDSLPMEQPSMLRTCFDLLSDRGVDFRAMETALAIPLTDIEEVCGLPSGYFDDQQHATFKFRLVEPDA